MQSRSLKRRSATGSCGRKAAGHSWQANGVAIEILAGGVYDLEGNHTKAQVVGSFEIALTNDLPLPITASLVRAPRIHDLLQAFIDIEVRFTAEAPLTLSLFEGHHLSVATWKESLTPFVLDLNIDAESERQAEVSYRIMRPESGWNNR